VCDLETSKSGGLGPIWAVEAQKEHLLFSFPPIFYAFLFYSPQPIL
jgi:hypothetical protein